MRCKHWRRVPLGLVQEARQLTPAGCVDRAVQCQLSVHEGDEHYGLLAELDEYGSALWLRWRAPWMNLVVLRDCSVAAPRPDGDGCCLFAGHPEQHTWEATPEEASCIS
ncbi:hypothetical protein G6W57_07855 [Streptomyces sp. CAI-121]|uniref:hypothetical protein n=1 Tax=unclassified Streptomyces TaxID=2593676 RepID=UPI0015876241|nr:MULTISPECIES: hypothetical protein [unclassified Streptomyces]NUV67023.1 hypothetical protein [Streptomyces sp. CAI-121]NUW13141.1 hypothetical protein [Streptomyces sp. CAI-68]